MQTDVALQCSQSVSGRSVRRYFPGLYSPALRGGVRLCAGLPFKFGSSRYLLAFGRVFLPVKSFSMCSLSHCMCVSSPPSRSAGGWNVVRKEVVS